MFISIQTHSDAYGQKKSFKFVADVFELKHKGTKIEISSSDEETKSSGSRGGVCHIVNKDLVIEIERKEIEKIFNFCIENQVINFRCQASE